MPVDPLQQPFLISRPRYYGVRCQCGAYMVLREIKGDPSQARCDVLNQPAWIVCVDCGEERCYNASDLIVFTWPPTPLLEDGNQNPNTGDNER